MWSVPGQIIAGRNANRVAHGSLFSSIFASFFVPFFGRFGGRFHHLAGENGMKITIKNDEKRLL